MAAEPEDVNLLLDFEASSGGDAASSVTTSASVFDSAPSLPTPPLETSPKGGDFVSGSADSVSAGAAAEEQPQQRQLGVHQWSTTKMVGMLRCINLTNGVGLIVTGLIIALSSIVSLSAGVFIAAMFVILFGTVLFCAEMKIQNLQPRIQRNFGFLFSFVGRLVFVIFTGTLCFALGSWVGYVIGSLTIANGLFNGFIVHTHPSFKSGKLNRFGDPYQSYSDGDAEVAAYIKANPHLAQNAGSSFASVAGSTGAAITSSFISTAMAPPPSAPSSDPDDPFDFPSPNPAQRANLV